MWFTLYLAKEFVKYFQEIYKKGQSQFLKPDFEAQQVHHFLADFNVVYIPEKIFTNGLVIRQLFVDGTILVYRKIYKIPIKNLRKDKISFRSKILNLSKFAIFLPI
jgi:hypothetical protein